MPYVFGYGSLVDRASIEASLARSVPAQDGPHPARINGFRRSWNSASHSSIRPEYAFRDGNGAPWQGWIVFLGIEAATGASTLGAYYRVSEQDLELLDARERSYDRTDVADQLDLRSQLAAHEPVFTYVPKTESRERAARIGMSGTVMARYLRLVDRGYRALGDELYAEHLATLPSPDVFTIDEITAAPLDHRIRNHAIDPGRENSSK